VELQRVVPCREGEDLVVASSTGRLLRLAVNEANLPVMGRTAQGPMLLRLLPGEAVVGAACVAGGDDAGVVLASRAGQLKRVRLVDLRRCQRGDLGQIGLRFHSRGDGLIDLCGDEAPLLGLRLEGGAGRSGRLRPGDLPAEDVTGTGIQLALVGTESLRELVPLQGP
jgi:DNA gyrase subunit A